MLKSKDLRVGYLLFTLIKFASMSLELWMAPLGRISICMNITKEGRLSKGLEMIRREARWTREINYSIHLSLGIVIKHIKKGSQHKVNIK